MEDKYYACMLLHAVGDTVGFKNSEWEFKKGGVDKVLEKVYEFIDLGGATHISLKGWRISDDTILHIKTAEALLTNFNSLNTYGNTLKEKYIEAYNQFEKEGFEQRYPGNMTINIIQRLKNGLDWNQNPYNIEGGGSGASMRCLCIGLAYNGESNRDKLMQMSIESSRITHNSATGYLGGYVSALFTALAIEKKPINEWPFILMEILQSDRIEKYIKESGRGLETYQTDSHIFISKWAKYIEDKFDDDHNIVKTRSSIDLMYRSRYYNDAFHYRRPKISREYSSKSTEVRRSYYNASSSNIGNIGSGGDDSVIIAYDSLIDAGNNWEKLVYYAMLHTGDADTTGCIAGGLYGALYGLKHVGENFLDNIEEKDLLLDLGKKLYNKFNKTN